MPSDRPFSVYILTNDTNGALYVGMTNDLERRVLEHKSKRIEGFTAKYNLTKLVYCEPSSTAIVAIEREKQIKGWLRLRKIALIELNNPYWKDLSAKWIEE